MKIRFAKSKDLPEIIGLWKIFMEEHEKNFGKEGLNKKYEKIYFNKLKKEIKSKNKIVHVVVEKNEIIGFASTKIEKEFPIYSEKKFGVFEDIFIKEEYRNKGIFNKLYEERTNWLKRRNVKTIITKVNIRNKKVISIYNKKGFKENYIILNKRLK